MRLPLLALLLCLTACAQKPIQAPEKPVAPIVEKRSDLSPETQERIRRIQAKRIRPEDVPQSTGTAFQ